MASLKACASRSSARECRSFRRVRRAVTRAPRAPLPRPTIRLTVVVDTSSCNVGGQWSSDYCRTARHRSGGGRTGACSDVVRCRRPGWRDRDIRPKGCAALAVRQSHYARPSCLWVHAREATPRLGGDDRADSVCLTYFLALKEIWMRTASQACPRLEPTHGDLQDHGIASVRLCLCLSI